MYWIPFPGEPNDNSRRILMEAKLPKSCNLPSFDSFVTRQHKPAGGSICVLAPPIFCHRSSSSPFTISKVMMVRILMIMMMVIRPAIFFFSLGHLWSGFCSVSQLGKKMTWWTAGWLSCWPDRGGGGGLVNVLMMMMIVPFIVMLMMVMIYSVLMIYSDVDDDDSSSYSEVTTSAFR